MNAFKQIITQLHAMSAAFLFESLVQMNEMLHSWPAVTALSMESMQSSNNVILSTNYK